MATKFPITQKEFKAFLASRKTLKFEGNNHCPIAAAINNKINRGKKKFLQQTIKVITNHTAIENESIPNPAWAKRFIARFDVKTESPSNISNKVQLRIAKSVANVA